MSPTTGSKLYIGKDYSNRYFAGFVDDARIYNRAFDENYAVRQQSIEREVSDYMRDAFSFAVVRIDAKEDRLRLESRLISTLSLCAECEASPRWLGHFSPNQKIAQGGLWLVNELGKEPLLAGEFSVLTQAATLPPL